MTIDKNIPIPKNQPKSSIYGEMLVGDSIWSTKRKYGTAQQWSNKNKMEFRFLERPVKQDGIDGFRIWRTK
jgi:hypothetical protein